MIFAARCENSKMLIAKNNSSSRLVIFVIASAGDRFVLGQKRKRPTRPTINQEKINMSVRDFFIQYATDLCPGLRTITKENQISFLVEKGRFICIGQFY